MQSTKINSAKISQKGLIAKINSAKKLESLHPFAVLDPLENSSMVPTHTMEPGNVAEIDASTVESFVTHSIDDDDNEECEIQEQSIRNIFEIIE